MTLAFRNVDADPSDPVGSWPYEGLVAAMERGSFRDWVRIVAEVRASPWGPVARRRDAHLAYARPPGSGALVRRAIDDARAEQEHGERAEVGRRVDALVTRSGLSAAEFAARLGTSPSRLSTYRSGRVMPSAAVIVRMERLVADLVGGR